MNPILKNVLAVIAGAVVGSIVNMALVMLGPMIIPLPAGADVTTTEGLKASMHLMETKNFIFPFLAHALGTLAGAFTAAKIGVNHKMTMAFIVGVLFLAGGYINMQMVGGPDWFNALDLLVAYLPMGALGGWLATRD